MNAQLVIEKLKAIGYAIRTDGRDIILSAEKDPDRGQAEALLADLKRCKAEAVRLLQGWPAEARTLIDRFLISPTQEAPFQLNPCTRVINSDVFYACLRREIESGPRGARARHGALQGDLRDLQAKLQ